MSIEIVAYCQVKKKRAAADAGFRGWVRKHSALPQLIQSRKSQTNILMNDAFICDAIRTPFGKYGGALSSIRTDDLAALPIAALMQRNQRVEWGTLDDVIYGCANQAGEDNRNVARMA